MVPALQALSEVQERGSQRAKVDEQRLTEATESWGAERQQLILQV